MTWQPLRRQVLQGMVVAATGGLAGCSNDSTNDDRKASNATSVDGKTQTTAEPQPQTATATATRTPVANPEEKVDNWLKHAQIYDGTILDERDQPRVTVSVGADAKDGFDGFSFDPPAIRITTGTEVTWLWTGDGGKHNVTEIDGGFTSGEPESGGGTMFVHTFDQAGLYRYKCTSHGNELNMRGAVIVEY
ncbi:halocyanin domain-containing protein [Halorientalis brevis]|uniref:Halocyanin domain-containing protein n=1 Tax=Halorientalis brevis TaxID=1126241 RepID=A0ABD6CCQ3_9EURY|nr:halocyanin domain-containing protein [Halorientalis brevis]